MVLRDIFLSDFKLKVKEIRNAFRESKLMSLKDLSNDCIKEAVTKNDPIWAELASISYSLYKLLSKVHVVESGKWPSLKKNILSSLNKCLEALEDVKIEAFENALIKVIENIFSVDMKLGNYVQNVHEKSRIKMASSAYAFGMSLAKAADLTGADRKSVQKYIGYTTIHDELREKISIKKRLKILKENLK